MWTLCQVPLPEMMACFGLLKYDSGRQQSNQQLSGLAGRKCYRTDRRNQVAKVDCRYQRLHQLLG